MLGHGQWDRLQIPVDLAFFFHHASLGHAVAFYPSPAGATESLLPLETWEEIVRASPPDRGDEPDVEALLVSKREQSFACYIVPIDACYELVGIVRRHWRGFRRRHRGLAGDRSLFRHAARAASGRRRVAREAVAG